MTVNRRDEIRARWNAITKGKWDKTNWKGGLAFGGEYVLICGMNEQYGEPNPLPMNLENTTFIAHAPDDIDYLLSQNTDVAVQGRDRITIQKFYLFGWNDDIGGLGGLNDLQATTFTFGEAQSHINTVKMKNYNRASIALVSTDGYLYNTSIYERREDGWYGTLNGEIKSWGKVDFDDIGRG